MRGLIKDRYIAFTNSNVTHVFYGLDINSAEEKYDMSPESAVFIMKEDSGMIEVRRTSDGKVVNVRSEYLGNIIEYIDNLKDHEWDHSQEDFMGYPI